MFDFTGFLTRDHAATSAANIDTPVRAEAPLTYTVYRNGVAFTLLNATPSLAARTVAGFRLATPDVAWTFHAAA